ncbi:MAG: hypothetical protein RI996_14 [Candidatus Parcubacteria bacterium]|jgi:hypothetical protein
MKKEELEELFRDGKITEIVEEVKKYLDTGVIEYDTILNYLLVIEQNIYQYFGTDLDYLLDRLYSVGYTYFPQLTKKYIDYLQNKKQDTITAFNIVKKDKEIKEKIGPYLYYLILSDGYEFEKKYKIALDCLKAGSEQSTILWQKEFFEMNIKRLKNKNNIFLKISDELTIYANFILWIILILLIPYFGSILIKIIFNIQ